MIYFFDALVFDKKKIMTIPTQNKLYSVLYIISIILVSSMVVIILKTTFLDYNLLSQNISNIEDISQDTLIYIDSVNSLYLEDEQLIYNGRNMIGLNQLKEWTNTDNIKDIGYMLSDNKQQFSFLLFLYQYLISLISAALFLVFLFLLTYTAKWQINISEYITFNQSMTYTSYILTIPILVNMLLRLLNFDLGLMTLIIVLLGVSLEFLFVKYYIKERVK